MAPVDAAPFPWDSDQALAPLAARPRPDRARAAVSVDGTDAADAPVVDADLGPRLAALEQDAFAKGYAQGERAGIEAAARQNESLMRRLAATIEEVAAHRTGLLRKTEHDVVRLAMALAERIVRREIAADRELLLALARMAVDRLGERVAATIYLHPVDHAAVLEVCEPRDGASSPVAIAADPLVNRGDCLVRSEFGLVDLGIQSQIAELSRELLGDEFADEESKACVPLGAD